MPLPSDPEARKRIAKNMVALWKLPPDQRKEVLMEAEAKRQAKLPAQPPKAS